MLELSQINLKRKLERSFRAEIDCRKSGVAPIERFLIEDGIKLN